MTTPTEVAAFVAEAHGADHQQVMRQAVNAVAEARRLTRDKAKDCVPWIEACRLGPRKAGTPDELYRPSLEALTPDVFTSAGGVVPDAHGR